MMTEEEIIVVRYAFLFCVNLFRGNRPRVIIIQFGTSYKLHRRRRKLQIPLRHKTPVIKGGEGAPRGPWCVFLSCGQHPSSRPSLILRSEPFFNSFRCFPPVEAPFALLS